MRTLEETVADAIKVVKANVDPVQFQHRYRMPEFGLLTGGRWSKWSGWKNGRVPKEPIKGWQYETRGLYAL